MIFHESLVCYLLCLTEGSAGWKQRPRPLFQLTLPLHADKYIPIYTETPPTACSTSYCVLLHLTSPIPLFLNLPCIVLNPSLPYKSTKRAQLILVLPLFLFYHIVLHAPHKCIEWELPFFIYLLCGVTPQGHYNYVAVHAPHKYIQ